MGPFNGVGIILMSMALIVFGVARQPNQYNHDPLRVESFSNARGLLDAAPFIVIALIPLLLYSRVKVDFVAGKVIRTYGFLPFIFKKEYVLDEATQVTLDGWQSRSGVTMTAKMHFKDGAKVALAHGDSQLGIEDVLGLASKLQLPVRPTEKLLRLKSSFVAKLLTDGKIAPPLPAETSRA